MKGKILLEKNYFQLFYITLDGNLVLKHFMIGLQLFNFDAKTISEIIINLIQETFKKIVCAIGDGASILVKIMEFLQN